MSSQTYQAVLFDLDGTLIDTAPEFTIVINRMLKADGKPELPASQIRSEVSNGARAMIKLAWGISEDDPRFNQTRQAFLDEYLRTIGMHTELFDGLQTSLAWCEQQGIPWGIVTNKPRLYSEALLQNMNLASRCAVLVCPDDVTNTKPDPEPILLACSQIKVAPNQCLYVGDHLRDIDAGAAAGTKTMAVCFGYLSDPSEAHRWNADFVISKPTELLTHLQDSCHAST